LRKVPLQAGYRGLCERARRFVSVNDRNERRSRVAGDEQIIYWRVANLVPAALGRS